MPASINLSEDAIFQDIRSVIVNALPGVQVVLGQVNRVPMPKPGFIEIWPIGFVRLATNRDTYIDSGQANNQGNTTNSEQPQKFTAQIDCYGELSYQWAAILTTIFRSDYGCSQMVLGQPLYTEDPLQTPLIDGEMQYEERWIIQAMFQYNPVIKTPIDFADKLGPVHIYPPGDFRK